MKLRESLYRTCQLCGYEYAIEHGHAFSLHDQLHGRSPCLRFQRLPYAVKQSQKGSWVITILRVGNDKYDARLLTTGRP